MFASTLNTIYQILKHYSPAKTDCVLSATGHVLSCRTHQ